MNKLTFLLCWLGAASALADPKADAHNLMRQAEHALDEARCFKVGCQDAATYPDAMGKVEQALALDTTGAHLAKACAFVYGAQGDAARWALSTGLMARALGWCDAASRHPDLDADTHERARSQLQSLRPKLQYALPPDQQDARLAAAARALYGVGLSRKHDTAKDELRFDYGELDAATLQGYVGLYWAAYAPEAVIAGDYDESQKQLVPKLVEARRFGFVLLDPRAKAQLCRLIADKMAKGKKELREWCFLQGVIEANSPLFAFRGQAVAYPASTDGAGVAFDDSGLTAGPDGKWNVVVTIAGPHPVDDERHVRRQLHMTGNDSWLSSAHSAEIAGLVARAQKIAKQKQEELARLEAKLVKKRPFVVFAASSFDGWTFPPLLAAGDEVSCQALHHKAYAKGDEDVDLQFLVDGAPCASQSFATTLSDSVTQPTQGQQTSCKAPLAAPGEHQVTLQVFTLVAHKVGKEVRDGVVQDRWGGAHGKKLGEWKIPCTTKIGNAAKRFD